MKKSTGVLLAGLLGSVLMSASVYPQKPSTTDQLNSLMTDSINLKATVKQLQESLDQKHAETTRLLQQVLTSFTAIDSSVQKLNESLNAVTAGMKTSDEKSARNLQETRTAMEALKKDVDDGILGLQNQVRSLTGKLNEMKSTEQQLPSAAQMFNQAWSELDAGFYPLAADDFREFLRNYPNDSVRSPSAQFYIGEALMAQKQFDKAADQFQIVLEKFPNSDRKCSALYRKGQALAELKQIPQATAALTSVTKDCAGTQEAANAAAELKSLPKPPRG